jgi:hypothetical protein
LSSPTQRSLEFLRKAGYVAAVVERRNAYAGPPEAKCPECGKNKIGISQDLFGFCDIIAIHPETRTTLAVQTTSGSNLSARRHKLMACGEVILCMAAGWKIELHAWAKHKIVRGGKAFRYELIRESLNG